MNPAENTTQVMGDPDPRPPQRGLTSSLGAAKKGTKSLRATIPEGIVAFLNIESGDRLEWRMEVKGGERFALVLLKKSSSVSQKVQDAIADWMTERKKVT